MAGSGSGGQRRQQWQVLTFCIFSMKREFWILGSVGKGADEEHNKQINI
jgi:hypothetical protein